MLKLKLQYFGHLMGRTDSLKRPWCGKDWGQEEKGTTEDEKVGWHHWLDGREYKQVLGVGDGQGGLACCSPWGHKELDTTERLNWTELNRCQSTESVSVHDRSSSAVWESWNLSKQNPGEKGWDSQSLGEIVVNSGRKNSSGRGGARFTY